MKRGLRRGDEVHQDVQLDGRKKRVVEETRSGGGAAGVQEEGAGPEEGDLPGGVSSDLQDGARGLCPCLSGQEEEQEGAQGRDAVLEERGQGARLASVVGGSVQASKEESGRQH